MEEAIILKPDFISEVNIYSEINAALEKENVTDKVISQLKEEYGGMKLRSIEDKEGYIDIKNARRNVRSIGILAEKACRKGREEAVRTQKLWIEKEKEVLKRIAEVQDPLDAEIDKYEKEVARKEEAERQRIAEQTILRHGILMRLGANYIGGSFVLNHISYESTLVKEVDEDIWQNTILPKYKAEFERVEADRVADE